MFLFLLYIFLSIIFHWTSFMIISSLIITDHLTYPTVLKNSLIVIFTYLHYFFIFTILHFILQSFSNIFEYKTITFDLYDKDL